MANDFIPRDDDGFNHFSNQFVPAVVANPTNYGLTTSDQSTWSAKHTDWNTVWDAYQAAKVAYNEALLAKDQLRAAFEAWEREQAAAIQTNPTVTDEARVTAALPVRKKTRTPVGEITTWPVLYRVDQEPLRHRLWFSDSATPGSKAKPEGAQFCEIRQTILAAGAPAPTDRAAMPFLASDSKSPHRTDFEDSEKGMVAYYAQRWVNTRQQPGPWGPITSYPIN